MSPRAYDPPYPVSYLPTELEKAARGFPLESPRALLLRRAGEELRRALQAAKWGTRALADHSSRPSVDKAVESLRILAGVVSETRWTECVTIVCDALEAALPKVAFGEEALAAPPVPARLFCPACGARHIDEGEWAERRHRTHLCATCKSEFRPFPFATVGVGPDSDAATALGAQLAELHAMATSHNPTPVSAEEAARFRKRFRQSSPERSMGVLSRMLAPHEASEAEVAEIDALWNRWDAETAAHPKAVLQMKLAEGVATLLLDRQARLEKDDERRQDDLLSAEREP